MKKTLLVFGFGLLGLASCTDATGDASEQAATEQVAEAAAEEAVAEEAPAEAEVSEEGEGSIED
tara:strand:- start:1827 stop:2018 length:192 start_codon:yes stop_codon:yes gene_type:complete